jgi:hypothetical protein
VTEARVEAPFARICVEVSAARRVEAVVSSARPAVRPLVLSCGSQLEAAAGYRFDRIACKGVGKHHMPEFGEEQGRAASARLALLVGGEAPPAPVPGVDA